MRFLYSTCLAIVCALGLLGAFYLLKATLGENAIPTSIPIRHPKPELGTPYVTGATFSHDKSYIMAHCLQLPKRTVTSSFAWVAVIDAGTGEEVGRIMRSTVWDEVPFAFLADSRYILSPDDHQHEKMKSAITLRELPSGKVVRTFDGEKTRIGSLAVSPDGKLALSGHYDGSIFLWDIETGKQVRAFDILEHLEIASDYKVFSVFFTPDAKHAFSGCLTTIKVWDVTTGKQIERSFAEYEKFKSSHRLMGHSANGKLACSGQCFLDREQPMVKVWDLASGERTGSFSGHPTTGVVYIRNAALTPDGRYGFSAATDCTLRQWEVATGREVWKVDLGKEYIASVAFSEDATLALINQDPGTIRLWDLAQRKELWNRGPVKGTWP